LGGASLRQQYAIRHQTGQTRSRQNKAKRGYNFVVESSDVLDSGLHRDVGASTTRHSSPELGMMLHTVSPEHAVFAGQLHIDAFGAPTFAYLHSVPGEHDVAALSLRDAAAGT